MFGKILFVTSRYGGLPRGMVSSLKHMQADYIETPIWNAVDEYKKFNPQVVIFFHHFLKEWDDEVITNISQIKCHKILWDWECPWEIDLIEKWHHPFSFVFVQDNTSARVLKDRIGDKVYFIPHAADPVVSARVDAPYDYRSDLCFIGAAYPTRLKFFREVLPKLKDYRVVIGGTGWEFLPDITGQKIINNGVDEANYIKYYSGTKVALNLHRLSDELTMSNKAFVPASSPNNRFFELNMMGCMQMVDNVRSPEIETYYSSTSVFENPGDFIVKFKGLLEIPDTCRRLGEEAHKESMEKHTYENRFIDLIARII